MASACRAWMRAAMLRWYGSCSAHSRVWRIDVRAVSRLSSPGELYALIAVHARLLAGRSWREDPGWRTLAWLAHKWAQWHGWKKEPRCSSSERRMDQQAWARGYRRGQGSSFAGVMAQVFETASGQSAWSRCSCEPDFGCKCGTGTSSEMKSGL
jgi:hypothetical protein